MLTSAALADLPDEALVRMTTVLALVPLARPTIYQRAAAGQFPAPIKLGKRGSAWRLGEIRKWLKCPTSWQPAQ
jgi:predicted DNA-binding transcriptional regulator AlpA